MDVKTLCLGVLTFGEASGYDIRQYFERGPFSHFAQAGYGSIYPALNKVLDEGFVTCRIESQDGRPDRKIYTLTKHGTAHLKEQLHQSLADDRLQSNYLVSLFLADLIDSDHLESVFDAYLQSFNDNVQMLTNLESDDSSPGSAFVREIGIVLYSSVAKHLSENRERFLTSIKNGERP